MVFPVHPRTRGKLEAFGVDWLDKAAGIRLTDPLGYYEFMNLVFNSRLIITDSGGVQEETTFLQIPCLTIRPNTERPVTITEGTNRLCTAGQLGEMADAILAGKFEKGNVPALWDGNTARRVADDLEARFLS
ncbi:MAG: UDP-N-acetylglucosamine 2-epimerase [Thermodesulfobacteriota bacterium]|nr:UDP-N-acetylglucosamine 2-epimerase [Thermodesulfobacteriota bacterium]